MNKYGFKLNKDNIDDFMSFCRMRMQSPTYDNSSYEYSKLEDIHESLTREYQTCSNCGEMIIEYSIRLIGIDNYSTFKIFCPDCGELIRVGQNDAIGATIKQFATENSYEFSPSPRYSDTKLDMFGVEKVEEENEDDFDNVEELMNKVTDMKYGALDKLSERKLRGLADEKPWLKTKIIDILSNRKEEENKKNNVKEEENKVMRRTNKGFNLGAMFGGLEFGAVKGNDFRLSIYGVAFKNGEGYVAYDKNKEELIDVDAMNFEGNGLLMKMPVAMSQVAVGDIIIHQKNAYVVKDIRKDGNLEVIAPGVAEIKIIMPVKNMFGFNFYTKVMPLIDMSTLGAGANEDNPFGMMMPMMMMNSIMGEDNDMDPMTMMFMMNSMNGGTMDMQSMLPLMMMSQGDIDPMMMMFMMQGQNGEMDMNMMLPLMMMGNKDNDMNPMMLMMMMNNGMFGKKETVDIEQLKKELNESFRNANLNEGDQE